MRVPGQPVGRACHSQVQSRGTEEGGRGGRAVPAGHAGGTERRREEGARDGAQLGHFRGRRGPATSGRAQGQGAGL